ncbi:unnamed protein product [Paramecium sonneborni]|uniref:Uncharacterized protein n=1 Tax=Paramecium sonneborni TaxID=65129 RepID=A0A8S1QY06_9CILI|nr:unnamed protein product [Paramecium sonneborni]
MLALLFFIFVTIYAQTYVGQNLCTALTTQADCGADVIKGKGWCYWNGVSCDTLPCYLIDEVAACRTGGSLQPGGAIIDCDSLETFSLQYDNVCCDKNLGKLNYAFVRFTMNFDGFVHQTSDAISITSLNVALSVKEMFKLYTINPWHVSIETDVVQFQAKLLAILNKYLDSPTRTVLLTQSRSHPFYLERTVYQSLQLLRDWTVRNKSPKTLRDAILPKIWSVALVALTRMTTFQPNYYQTNYYFINFAIIPYFRNQIKMQGQMHTLTIDWSGYSYTNNGFVMVYSYAPEQFGITKAYSDVVSIRPFLGNTVAYVDTQDNYDNLFYPLKFIYYWSDTSITIVQANLKLFAITNDADPTIYTDTGATFTCDSAARICTSSVYNPSSNPNLQKGQSYYIGLVDSVIDKKRAQCILAYNTWTTACA